MGDPKKLKKKFSKPGHPWQKERIEEETQILKDYGLRRKYEIWKMDSLLKKFLNRAKKIIGERTLQSELEGKQMLERLYLLGLMQKESKFEDVLNLTLKNVMERRLQTLVYKKRISRTIVQARELIVHQHIGIGSKSITSPSYLVSISEEPQIRLLNPINISVPEAASEGSTEVKEKRAERRESRPRRRGSRERFPRRERKN